jgi:glucose/arabinose dehydrogenase
MDWQPETYLMFQTEHGPSLIDGVSLFKRSGGDEVNIVERGKNYGWAEISHKMKRTGMETAISNILRQSRPRAECFIAAICFPNTKTISFSAR